MVRTRYPDSVKIQISGVKSIIPNARIEIGRRSMTWLTFLNDVCGVQLDSNQKYFICNSGYSPNHSVEGWTASLNDPIEQFVIKFTKKLSKYCVRLHKGPRPTQTKRNPQSESGTVKNQVRVSSSDTCASPLEASPLAKPRKTLIARKFASIVPMKPSELAKLSSASTKTDQYTSNDQKLQKNGFQKLNGTKSALTSDPLLVDEEELCKEDMSDDNDDFDMMNAEEIVDSEQMGNKLEANNLVEKFEQEIDKMDESMLEEICKEIQNLRQSELWERNLKRSPLACCLLWEVCKK